MLLITTMFFLLLNRKKCVKSSFDELAGVSPLSVALILHGMARFVIPRHLAGQGGQAWTASCKPIYCVNTAVAIAAERQ